MNPVCNPKDRTILDLCGGTGSWSRPYRERGYSVFVVDSDIVLSPDMPFKVEELLRQRPAFSSPVHGILAAPPCTVFTNASSRLWGDYDQDGRTDAAMAVVQACLDLIEFYNPRWWALENPPGRLPQLWRKSDWSFVANDYGDPHIKRTHIWGTAVKPPVTDRVSPVDNHALHRKGGSGASTKTARSITPPGFARAFCNANP